MIFAKVNVYRHNLQDKGNPKGAMKDLLSKKYPTKANEQLVVLLSSHSLQLTCSTISAGVH
jgi:hypothetical protein